MTERIEVHVVKKQGPSNTYFIKDVCCPKTNGTMPAKKCKSCQHCRIYLGTHVKCTYRDDMKRAALHPENIV